MAGGRGQILRSRQAPMLARPAPINVPQVPPINARGFSTTPTPSYSCFDPCPDGASEQVPEYIPYLFSPFYKRVKIPGRGVDELFNVCIPKDTKGGYCKPWWFIKAFGFDEVIDTTDENAALPEVVPAGGDPYSMLKLEVIGTEYGKFKARFVFDIGTRFDISLGAYQRLTAHVLVPDLNAYRANGGFVSDTPPYNLQDFRAKSLIVPSAVGVDSTGGFRNGRYTQSLFLSAADQASQMMALPNGSKEVIVWTDDGVSAPTLTFLSPLGLPVAVTVPTLGAPVEIPDNADRVTVTIAGADAGPRVVTLIFRLDV